eukprot:3409274-Lingulodinium_polyedra.AAC.1
MPCASLQIASNCGNLGAAGVLLGNCLGPAPMLLRCFEDCLGAAEVLRGCCLGTSGVLLRCCLGAA